MSIHSHVAIMEIPADGVVRFASRPLDVLAQRPGHGPLKVIKHDYKGVLRLFRPDGDPDWVSEPEIEELKQLAATLFSASNRVGALDELARAHAPSSDNHEVRYFELVSDLALHEVHAGELAMRAREMAVLADQNIPLPGLLFQIEQYDPNVTLRALFEGFNRSFSASVKTEAHGPRVVVTAPTRTPAQASAALRDQLLGLGWPTSADVGASHGSKAGNRGQWAKDRRDRGELFGVWSPNERTFRHPTFQFDETGAIRPLVKELIAAMAANPEFAPDVDKGGWRRAFWLYGPTLTLAGANGAARTPADVFASEPGAVIQAARATSEAMSNDAW